MAPIIRAPIVLPIEPSAAAAGHRRDAEPRGAPLFVLDDGDDGFRSNQEWTVLAGQLDDPGRAGEHSHGGLHVFSAEFPPDVPAVGETNNCHASHRTSERSRELASQIFDWFDARADANEPVADAERVSLFPAHAAMRAERRMADRGRHVSEARREPDPVAASDEGVGGGASAAEVETEHRAARTRKQPPGSLGIAPAADPGVVNGRDAVRSLKPRGER